MMKVLLLSTSTVYGKPYLEYCNNLLEDYYKGIKSLLFVPYARPGGTSHDDYTKVAAARFDKLGIKTRGIHEFKNDKYVLNDFEAMFIGGGNTFLLLKQLYNFNLLDAIKERVVNGKMQYMGTSAGSNIAGMSINTTNDMPIVYPPSFDSLGIVPFNLNPHYLDPDPTSKHKGETRETRIKEFHSREENKQKVVGLREGSGLLIENSKVTLTGELPARIFTSSSDPIEYKANSDLSFLM
ncbi:dipeptidase PepE [Candidatus Kapabacteria bacterium]|nr:dipeptidase PepE [Candidatus Kapabacteria bacterium]